MLKKLIVKEVEKGKIVLFSSHQMPYVEEFCEHICIINQGEIVLNGRIREIKRTYPRNRILIQPEGPPGAFIDELKRQRGWENIVSDTKQRTDDLEVTLKSETDKQNLIQMMVAAGLGVDKIEVVEPTLEEIFVEKAGGLQ